MSSYYTAPNERAQAKRYVYEFSMSITPISQVAIAAAWTLILSSSASQHPALRTALPKETPFDERTIAGGPVLVKLRSDATNDLLFLIDTGSPGSVLDKSLESTLGKALGQDDSEWAFGPAEKLNVFKSPKLYLGETQLLTADLVEVEDSLSRVFQCKEVLGVLGMDCLQHYCVQLDFSAKKIRFLDPELLSKTDLGKAFPLEGQAFTPSIRLQGPELGDVRFRVDTGLYGDADGCLVPRIFRRALEKPKRLLTSPYTNSAGQSITGIVASVTFGGQTYTNIIRTAALMTNTFGGSVTAAQFLRIHFGSETYTNLVFAEAQKRSAPNWIGMRFLARHLVTLNFPKRVMYLKRVSDDPPP